MSRIAEYTRRNPLIVVLITLVLCIATVTVMAVAYRHRQHVNDQRFCTLMHVLLQPEKQPQTPRGIAVQQAIQDLSDRLGCPRA